MKRFGEWLDEARQDEYGPVMTRLGKLYKILGDLVGGTANGQAFNIANLQNTINIVADPQRAAGMVATLKSLAQQEAPEEWRDLLQPVIEHLTDYVSHCHDAKALAESVTGMANSLQEAQQALKEVFVSVNTGEY